MYSKTIVIGNLGKDSELKMTSTGRSVCSTSIAVNDKIGGERRTTWFNLNIWGKLAEQVHPYLKKGKQIYAEGRLRIDEWQDKNNQKQVSLVIDVENLRLLGTGGDTSVDDKDMEESVINGYQNEISTADEGADDDVPF